jgi:hypothetical protein
MSEKMSPEREALLHLADALAENIDRTSDTDLLAEAAEDKADIQHLADAMRNLFDKVESEAGKAKMAAARAAVDADRRRGSESVVRLDPAVARRRLAEVIARSRGVEGRLTLAARKAEELSDDDVLAILENLEELGVISDEGGAS